MYAQGLLLTLADWLERCCGCRTQPLSLCSLCRTRAVQENWSFFKSTHKTERCHILFQVSRFICTYICLCVAVTAEFSLQGINKGLGLKTLKHTQQVNSSQKKSNLEGTYSTHKQDHQNFTAAHKTNKYKLNACVQIHM